MLILVTCVRALSVPQIWLSSSLAKGNGELNKYQIWVEGFRGTGDGGFAQLAGVGYGNSFKEAASKFFAGKEEDWGQFSPERMTVWGCGVFDNEIDARRSFG